MLSALYNKNCFYNNPVRVEYSKLCEGVLKMMKEGGYVNRYDVIENEGKKI